MKDLTAFFQTSVFQRLEKFTLSFFHTTDTCPGDQFTCVNSNGCVLKDRVCDGIVNCADATDEGKEALCGKLLLCGFSKTEPATCLLVSLWRHMGKYGENFPFVYISYQSKVLFSLTFLRQPICCFSYLTMLDRSLVSGSRYY